jgi:hypothetical protein
MPGLKVTTQKGAPVETPKTSYGSYAFTYASQADPVSRSRPALSSLSVGLAMGMDFFTTDGEVRDPPCPHGFGAHKTQNNSVVPPQVSCINRHQVFIWMLDEQANIRGLLLSFSVSFVSPHIDNYPDDTMLCPDHCCGYTKKN